MHLGGVTANPTAERTVHQARNLALSLGERLEGVKLVIRDRGSKFTQYFDAVFQANGTRILRTAVQAPRMNAICERLVGTVRGELLDRVLILGGAHLRAVLAEYQVHYNGARPHQGIAQRVPDTRHDTPPRHDRPRHQADPPKTHPQRPDQRIRARGLTADKPQFTGLIVFPSETGSRAGADTAGDRSETARGGSLKVTAAHAAAPVSQPSRSTMGSPVGEGWLSLGCAEGWVADG